MLKYVRLFTNLSMLLVTAWVAWTVHGATSGGASASADANSKAKHKSIAELASRLVFGETKDPFRKLNDVLTDGLAEVDRQSKGDAEKPEKADPADEVARMTLQATLVGPRKQVALIDGRFYEPGDALVGSGGARLPFRVQKIEASKVVVEGPAKKQMEVAYSANARAPADPPGPAALPAGPQAVAQTDAAAILRQLPGAAETVGKAEALGGLLNSPIGRYVLGSLPMGMGSGGGDDADSAPPGGSRTGQGQGKP